MATPIYPRWFPLLTSVNGFRPATRIRETDGGETAVRSSRLYTYDPGAVVSVEWDLRTYEYAMVDYFIQNDLREATKWFWMPLPSGDGLLSWHIVRFQNKPVMQAGGTMQFRLSATLEILNRFVVKERDYTLPTGPLPTDDEDDPMWSDVRALMPFSAAAEMEDVRHENFPEIYNDVTMEAYGPSNVGNSSVRVGGVEALLSYWGSGGMYDVPREGQDWTIECWFRRTASNGNVWVLGYKFGWYMGLRVDENTVTFYTQSYEIKRYGVIKTQGWHHCIVQSRRGLIEIAFTHEANATGKLVTCGPSYVPGSSGGDGSDSFVCIGGDGLTIDFFADYMSLDTLTGEVADFRFTGALRYP